MHVATAITGQHVKRSRGRALRPKVARTMSAPTSLAAVAMIAGSMVAFADDDAHARDVLALKDLHVAFHRAVSHVGIDPATKLARVEAVLALWTDDGVFISGGVTYSGKGAPGTASCDPGSMTLCDLSFNHAGVLC
jgi:hypothetical protein